MPFRFWFDQPQFTIEMWTFLTNSKFSLEPKEWFEEKNDYYQQIGTWPDWSIYVCCQPVLSTEIDKSVMWPIYWFRGICTDMPVPLTCKGDTLRIHSFWPPDNVHCMVGSGRARLISVIACFYVHTFTDSRIWQFEWRILNHHTSHLSVVCSWWCLVAGLMTEMTVCVL